MKIVLDQFGREDEVDTIEAEDNIVRIFPEHGLWDVAFIVQDAATASLLAQFLTDVKAGVQSR